MVKIYKQKTVRKDVSEEWLILLLNMAIL